MVAKSTPELLVPPSSATVQVSIIDTTSRVDNVSTDVFLDPIIPCLPFLKTAPAWSFLIEHDDAKNGHKERYLFDLGIRKDWQNMPTKLLERVRSMGWKTEVRKNVSEILLEHEMPLESINGIIWSHHHWDHTGDPSTFPATTDLIVGPGFKEHHLPAWPTNPDAIVDEKAFVGRNLREIDIHRDGGGLRIGEYDALDFFGDGSLFLLHSTGHTPEHLTALARTSTNPDTFFVMGGDTCHHGGALKPSEFDPLPDEINPNPLYAPFAAGVSPCPGALFEPIHPKQSRSEPFYTISRLPEGQNPNYCRDDAVESLRKLIRFEAQENMFVLVAHDSSVFGIIDEFPKPANEWKQKGWKEQHKWRFLENFRDGLSK